MTLPSPGPDHRGCPYTCQCHEFGANGALCDPVNFQCDCKIGVVGKTCNQCKLGWWGIRLIQTMDNEGCLPCQCNAMGAARSDCEQTTGRCQCKSGVTGKKCNMCAEEGMILTADGCKMSNGSLTNAGKEETCDNKDCGNGKCFIDENLMAGCSCNYTCEDEIDYICGSDGKTYANICHLRREACADPNLMEIMRGECLQEGTTDTPSTTAIDFPPSTTEKGIWDTWFGSGRYLADEGQRDDSSDSADDPFRLEGCKESTCENGGTCINESQLGYTCLCNIHWTGPNCQQVNGFTSPGFSGSSFIQYPWSYTVSTLFDLRLTIIPTNGSGVILFAGKAAGRDDFMSLVLNDGYVQFRFNNGGGTVLLQSESKINTNDRYNLRVKKDGRSGLLSITGQSVVRREAPGTLNSLDIEPILNIGLAYMEYSKQPPKRLLRNLGGVAKGFQGCISMLHDAEADINFILRNTKEASIMDGRSIEQCTSDPCLKAPCLNNGLCQMINAFNYKCQCTDSFTGANCNSRSKRTRHLIGSIANRYGGDGNVFEVPRLSGRSYLQYALNSEVDYKFNFNIVFNTGHADGVLLYGSQSKDHSDGDFILLSLEDQVPVLRFDLGAGVTELRLDERFPLKQWNLLTFNRSGKHVWMSLNDLPSKATTAFGEMSYLNINNHVILGAIPDTMSHDKGYLHSPGFQGVIQRVAINEEDIMDFFGSASLLYEVRRYHGLPCHPNPCAGGYYCIPELESYRCDPKF